VGKDRGYRFRKLQPDGDVLKLQLPAHNREDALHRFVDINLSLIRSAFLQTPASIDDISSPVHLGAHFCSHFLELVLGNFQVPLQHHDQEITSHLDRIERLVKLMSHPCRHLAERFHLARLDELRLFFHYFGDVHSPDNNDRFALETDVAGMKIDKEGPTISLVLEHLLEEDTTPLIRFSDERYPETFAGRRSQVEERFAQQFVLGISIQFQRSRFASMMPRVLLSTKKTASERYRIRNDISLLIHATVGDRA